MDRIYLTKNCVKILRGLKDGTYTIDPQTDNTDLYLLEYEGLIDVIRIQSGDAIDADLTTKGIVYIHSNPKLKNPSIWEDTKYWITTAFAVAATAISIVALF